MNGKCVLCEVGNKLLYVNEITVNLLKDKDKKVKYTPVQALRLCTGRTAYRGSRGIALPFHVHGTRRG
jgi:hypothetical protein